jgi:GT2 family glycosyltransferase
VHEESDSEQRLEKLTDRIEALSRELTAERQARAELEARMARHAAQIAELNRAVRSIVSSRIWQTLSSAGMKLLSMQSRLARTLGDLRVTPSRSGPTPVSGPLISVLMPVYNTPERWLRASLDSVVAQTYPNWELCVADDRSPQPHVARVLNEYSVRDARIRVAFRQENGGISAASNTALEMVRGEYVALLDHDDELEPDALAEVAAELLRHPDADMIYTDEDKIDESGFQFETFHKPDWSPEFFLGCMYTCHLGVFRTQLVRDIGGFRSETDGSQDYDLVLRLTGRTQRVYHIPKVLYHWRTIESSSASGGTAKDYAYAAAHKALEDAVAGRGIEAQVLPGPALGTYRVHSSVRGPQSVELIRGGESAEINARAEHTGCEYLLILRDSVSGVSEGWREALMEYCQLPGVGAVGPKVLDAGGRILSAGIVFADGRAMHAYAGQAREYPGYFLTAQLARNCLAVSGSCLMTKTQVFREAGGFDTRLSPVNAAVDYCVRLSRRGFRNVYTPYAEVMDSRPAQDDLAGAWPQTDPYYNPNLPIEFAFLPPPAA